MTDEELIARLRRPGYLAFNDGTDDYGTAPDAADRIEALVKQCEDLAQAAMNNGQALILAEARICELEARLAEPPAVTVKPLVWVKHTSKDIWRAIVGFGVYKVFGVSFPSWDFDSWSDAKDKISKSADTIEAAKAAAQSDYAARILPAIDARPASAVRNEALEEAATAAYGRVMTTSEGMAILTAQEAAAAIRALKGGAK